MITAALKGRRFYDKVNYQNKNNYHYFCRKKISSWID